jgi:hypothetical protein
MGLRLDGSVSLQGLGLGQVGWQGYNLQGLGLGGRVSVGLVRTALVGNVY